MVARSGAGGSGAGRVMVAVAVAILAVAVLVAVPGTASAAAKCTSRPYPDVAVGSVHCGTIAWMKAEGLAVGYKDGTFGPAKGVTRGAMATFIHRLQTSKPAPKCTSRPYPDVPVSSVHCGTIAWMKTQGLAAGYKDGTYGPVKGVTRGAMATFIYRLQTSKPAGPSGSTPTVPPTTTPAAPAPPPEWVYDPVESLKVAKAVHDYRISQGGTDVPYSASSSVGVRVDPSDPYDGSKDIYTNTGVHAWGYFGAANVLQAWIDSPGHHNNMLDEGADAIGITCSYWTIDDYSYERLGVYAACSL